MSEEETLHERRSRFEGRREARTKTKGATDSIISTQPRRRRTRTCTAHPAHYNREVPADREDLPESRQQIRHEVRGDIGRFATASSRVNHLPESRFAVRPK